MFINLNSKVTTPATPNKLCYIKRNSYW